MFFRSFVKVKVLLLVGGLLWAAPVFAVSISVGEQIINSDFQTDKGKSYMEDWAKSATGVAGRLSTNTLNTSGGNAGFDRFFNSAFAALGIGVSTGTSSISQTFDLASYADDGRAVKAYDLEISFSTVFDGRDYNNTLTNGPRPDVFSAYLSGNGEKILLFSQDSFNFPGPSSKDSSANQQLANNALKIALFGLDPGSYTLTFSLFEDNGTGTNINSVTSRYTDTVAGIDNVSVMATAVIANPEPSTLLLLGGGLVALVPLVRRRNKEK